MSFQPDILEIDPFPSLPQASPAASPHTAREPDKESAAMKACPLRCGALCSAWHLCQCGSCLAVSQHSEDTRELACPRGRLQVGGQQPVLVQDPNERVVRQLFSARAARGTWEVAALRGSGRFGAQTLLAWCKLSGSGLRRNTVTEQGETSAAAKDLKLAQDGIPNWLVVYFLLWLLRFGRGLENNRCAVWKLSPQAYHSRWCVRSVETALTRS